MASSLGIAVGSTVGACLWFRRRSAGGQEQVSAGGASVQVAAITRARARHRTCHTAGMPSSRWYAPSIDMPDTRGPFRPEHVKDGDRYEVSRGHPVYVAPAGARHGREHIVGALPLATDPAVREVGLDVGYQTDQDTLRAPDIAVGNVPDRPGWAVGAPALAVEYADRGTDEQDLQTKIAELMGAGTRFGGALARPASRGGVRARPGPAHHRGRRGARGARRSVATGAG